MRAIAAAVVNTTIFFAFILGPSRLITGGWPWLRVQARILPGLF